MSTRSTTHFIDSSYTDPKTGKPFLNSIVYRHSDGYPKGAGLDLFRFLARCKKLKDSRLTDTSYLAAKYVVFLAEMFAVDYSKSTAPGIYAPNKDRLDFLSVGVMSSDPGDIEYRYVVDCSVIGKRGLPKVTCYKVSVGDDGTDTFCEETAIPGRTKVASTPAPAVDEWINSFTIPSRTKSNVTYTIEQNRSTLAWKCSCPSFKFSKTGRCKHIDALPFRTRYTTAANLCAALRPDLSIVAGA